MDPEDSIDTAVCGRVLSRNEVRQLFGESESNRSKGIVHSDGKVQWIFVRVGQGAKYPNEVTEMEVRYCYSPVAAANQAMQNMFDSGEEVLVKVAVNGAPATYLWGTGVVHELCEVYQGIRRYVIRRKQDPTSVLAASIPVGSPAQHRETSPVGAKRMRGTGGVENWDANGVQYDSLLERRHQLMLSRLHFRWSRSVCTFHDIELGDGKMVSYTPDFIVEAADGTTLFLEIKPCYPYENELRRCEEACRRIGAIPIVLLYNTAFRCPFEMDGRTDAREYAHSRGVRGIRFTWDRTAKRVVRDHDVAYAALDGENGTLEARTAYGTLDPFVAEWILRAYDAVTNLEIDVME